MEHFWTNTVWYILLGILTFFELVFVMFKAKNRRMAFAFYITLLGIVLIFETAILIFLKAYVYYPKILENPPIPFDDVLVGNLFSQTSVAATADLVAILKLKYYWFFVFAGIYGLIEELFLHLGIYGHYWYRTWMTLASIPIFCWIAKILYKKITKGIPSLFYYGYIFAGLFSLNVITLTWGLMVSGMQDFSITVLADPINSRHFLALAHFAMLSAPLMLIYFGRFKWLWKAMVILTIYAIYYPGYKYNLILIKEGWFWPIATISIIWMYLSIYILDKLYDAKKKLC